MRMHRVLPEEGPRHTRHSRDVGAAGWSKDPCPNSASPPSSHRPSLWRRPHGSATGRGHLVRPPPLLAPLARPCMPRPHPRAAPAPACRARGSTLHPALLHPALLHPALFHPALSHPALVRPALRRRPGGARAAPAVGGRLLGAHGARVVQAPRARCGVRLALERDRRRASARAPSWYRRGPALGAAARGIGCGGWGGWQQAEGR